MSDLEAKDRAKFVGKQTIDKLLSTKNLADLDEIVGEITKGKYHNSEIPIIKVTEIKKVDMPENIFVLPPNKTYIPTSGIL